MTPFPFDFDPHFRPLLLVWGAKKTNSIVWIDGAYLRARFGLLKFHTPLSNIESAEVTGPYRWYRAIGVRASLKDGGLTFGTTACQGVCIKFRDPVSVVPKLKHSALTVTVEECDELVAALTR